MKDIIFWILGILAIVGAILAIMAIDEDDLS